MQDRRRQFDEIFLQRTAVLVRAAKPVASVDGYEIRFVGSDRYRMQYKTVEDRSFSPEIVGRRSRGVTSATAPETLTPCRLLPYLSNAVHWIWRRQSYRMNRQQSVA